MNITRWGVHRRRIRLNIFGDNGGLEIECENSETALKLCQGEDVATATFRTIECPPTPNTYARFVESIRTGVNDQPDFVQGAKIQKILDACWLAAEQGQPVTV